MNSPRSRLAAFLLGTSLLPGCVGLDTPPLVAGESLVLLRSRTAEPSQSETWSLDTERRIRSSTGQTIWRPVSRQRTQAGDWWQAALAPGRYVIRFADGTSAAFQVPVQASRVYIGSLRPDCVTGTYVPGCEPPGLVQDESATAAEILGAQAQTLAGPVTALSRPFDIGAARRGWPAASGIVASTSPDAWQASMNWHEFIDRGGSRFFLGSGVGTAVLGLQIGSALSVPTAGYGMLVAVPFLGLGAGLGAIGLAAAVGEEAAEEFRRHQLTPCLEGLASQLAAPALDQRIASSVRPPEAAPSRAARPRGAAVPWQATVTRLVLRRCGDRGSYGLEVASRWTAPGRDARFVRSVSGAQSEPQLNYPRPAPWETVAPTEAPCRPFVRYCEPDGADLLRQDVIDALAAARDTIAAGP